MSSKFPPGGRLESGKSVLIICDLQEKYRSKVKFFTEIVKTANRAIRGANALGIYSIVTELFPKGMGSTVTELGLGSSGVKIIQKTQFSVTTPEVDDLLKKMGPSPENIYQIALCGVEAHAAILQSAFSLLERHFEVHVLADACSSTTQTARKMAFDRMRQSGIYVTTLESALMSWVKDLNNPKYEEIQKILHEPESPSDLDKA